MSGALGPRLLLYWGSSPHSILQKATCEMTEALEPWRSVYSESALYSHTHTHTKLSQNHPQNHPKTTPKPSQNHPKTTPKQPQINPKLTPNHSQIRSLHDPFMGHQNHHQHHPKGGSGNPVCGSVGPGGGSGGPGGGSGGPSWGSETVFGTDVRNRCSEQTVFGTMFRAS